MSIYKTSDLALAAYMTFKGLPLISARRLPTGRFEFELNDESSQADALAIEYVGSEFCEFDNKVRALKKLIYSN
jgi:hypothetical protein